MTTNCYQTSLSEFDDEIDSYTGMYKYDAEDSSLCTYDNCDSDCSLDTEHSFAAPTFSPCRIDDISNTWLNNSELLMNWSIIMKIALQAGEDLKLLQIILIRTLDHHLSVMITKQTQFTIFIIMLSCTALICQLILKSCQLLQ